MINFEKLTVYQDSVNLAIDFYKITKTFPKSELFGLISQIRRASVSISLNIAEGSSRSAKDFRHFLDISRGSCFELVPLIKISTELGYLSTENYGNLLSRIELLAKKLNALKRSIN